MNGFGRCLRQTVIISAFTKRRHARIDQLYSIVWILLKRKGIFDEIDERSFCGLRGLVDPCGNSVRQHRLYLASALRRIENDGIDEISGHDLRSRHNPVLKSFQSGFQSRRMVYGFTDADIASPERSISGRMET